MARAYFSVYQHQEMIKAFNGGLKSCGSPSAQKELLELATLTDLLGKKVKVQ